MARHAHWSVAQRACLDVAWLVFGLPHRLRIEARANVPPSGGLLVVANHASVLDPVFLSLAVPRPLRFLVKPLPPGFEPVQSIYDTYGCITAGSGRQLALAMGETARAVADGAALAIFPEGRVSPDGRLLPFQTGAARVALTTGCAILPAWIEGAHRAMPPGRVLPRLAPVSVRFGSVFHLGRRVGAGPPRAHDLNRATMVLTEAVARLAPAAEMSHSC